MSGSSGNGFLDEFERRALEAAAEASRSLGEERLDLIEALRGEDEQGRREAPDLTLGGYIAEHDRPPAFEGNDGQPYTVGIEVEATGEAEHPYAAFLVFVRWAATGAGIMDHVESEDVAFGATAEAAQQGALELSLYEVKAALDAAIERQRAETEE